MITRRKILTGTAAASIAAIASARGVEAASPGSPAGIDVGLGNLAGGAVAAFNKDRDTFSVSLKWDKAAAEVFYKPQLGAVDGVEIFYKLHFKGWTPVTSFPLEFFKMVPGVEAMFKNVGPNGAEFFLKDPISGKSVLTTLTTNSEGLNLDVTEDTPGD